MGFLGSSIEVNFWVVIYHSAPCMKSRTQRKAKNLSTTASLSLFSGARSFPLLRNHKLTSASDLPSPFGIQREVSPQWWSQTPCHSSHRRLYNGSGHSCRTSRWSLPGLCEQAASNSVQFCEVQSGCLRGVVPILATPAGYRTTALGSGQASVVVHSLHGSKRVAEASALVPSIACPSLVPLSP